MKCSIPSSVIIGIFSLSTVFRITPLASATLIAVFTNPESPQVTLDEMEYAIKLAEFGCDDILAANNKGYIGEGENPRVDALLEKSKLFLKMKPL